jgi:His/Glu/Gln/Arg/opine family amino acid ABC transporter permease subunit
LGILDIIIKYREGFLGGLIVTLKLAGIAWSTGLVCGGAIGMAAYKFPQTIGIALRAMAFVVTGIPFLVLLYWAHFPLQVTLNVVVDPFVTAAAILSIVNSLIVAEIWRNSLAEFRREYALSATACGLSQNQMIRYILFPLVCRQSIPTLLAVQVAVLQSTLFASLISVEELFRVAQRINASIHKPVEIYTALAVFFLVLCVPPYMLAFWLKQRFTRDVSEQ